MVAGRGNIDLFKKAFKTQSNVVVAIDLVDLHTRCGKLEEEHRLCNTLL